MTTTTTRQKLTIAQEKAIAQELLEVFSILDPTCVIAGGAPRNWNLNQNANDFDVYVTSIFDNTVDFDDFDNLEPIRDPLDRQMALFHKNHKFFSDNDITEFKKKPFAPAPVGSYNDCRDKLLDVYEFKYFGHDVDIMLISSKFVNKIDYVAKKFDSTISMILMNGKGELIKCHDKYDQLVEEETILYYHPNSNIGGRAPKTKYSEKLVKQFPNWKHMTFKDADQKELIYL